MPSHIERYVVGRALDAQEAGAEKSASHASGRHRSSCSQRVRLAIRLWGAGLSGGCRAHMLGDWVVKPGPQLAGMDAQAAGAAFVLGIDREQLSQSIEGV